MIKNVMIIRNVVTYDKHHDRFYPSEKGILFIEYVDGKKATLDLESMNDITDCDYLEVCIEKNVSECEYLFKNIVYDTEKLKRLAEGVKTTTVDLDN